MLGWIGRLFVPARKEPCEECERLRAEIHRLRGVVDRQDSDNDNLRSQFEGQCERLEEEVKRLKHVCMKQQNDYHGLRLRAEEECGRLRAEEECGRLRADVRRLLKDLFRLENCIRHLQAEGRRLAEQLGREKGRRDVQLRPGRN